MFARQTAGLMVELISSMQEFRGSIPHWVSTLILVCLKNEKTRSWPIMAVLEIFQVPFIRFEFSRSKLWALACFI